MSFDLTLDIILKWVKVSLPTKQGTAWSSQDPLGLVLSPSHFLSFSLLVPGKTISFYFLLFAHT